MQKEGSDNEGLVKLYLDLPDDEGVGGESLWARPVGPDLYEIRNVPFHAYDLHFNDVVRASTIAPGEKPRIQEVVKRSGHRTLRVIFPDATPESRQAELLGELRPFGATYERATRLYVAIDVEPSGDYQAVCDRLWAWEKDGILEYETGVR